VECWLVTYKISVIKIVCCVIGPLVTTAWIWNFMRSYITSEMLSPIQRALKIKSDPVRLFTLYTNLHVLSYVSEIVAFVTIIHGFESTNAQTSAVRITFGGK
jgi:hypothetical protein